MKREKSCGALIYRYIDGRTELLLLKHRFGGHWSFPKGHVEKGENEVQTALREVREETGLSIELHDGFRQSVEYYPRPNVKKQVVYFLGHTENQAFKAQEEEISEIRWIEINEALSAVTYKNDRNLINRARRFLSEMETPQSQPSAPAP